MKHQVLLQRPGKVRPPTVTTSLGCKEKSSRFTLTDSPLQTSSVPSLSPEDTGKHHPGWSIPQAETLSSSARAYRALRWMGPKAAPRTHMGSPVWTASNHFTTTSPGREQKDHERAGCPGRGPASAVQSHNAGCTICPFPRMAMHLSPPPPWQDLGMLPKSGHGLILCQNEPHCAPPTQGGQPRAPGRAAPCI